LCAFYGNTETMGTLLPSKSNQFFQLYLCVISAMCVIRTTSISTFYSDDERPKKTPEYGRHLETVM
jgi:hypothetical protein